MWHFLINTAYAQATDFGVTYGSYTGLSGQDPRILIANIVRIALGVLGIIAVMLILYAGFTWMTAAGEQEKIDRAKKTLIGAVIGLVIIVSSFAIASFVLNSLSEATGLGSQINGGGGGGPGGSLGGGSGIGFRPTGIKPTGTLKKRDVVASVTFSSAPTGDTANLKANIKLEKVAAGVRTPVDYDSTVSQNTVRLVPKTACPAPNATKFCLDADSDYTVTVSSGLKSGDGTSTANCGIGTNCTASFHTGDVVNTTLPTAKITFPSLGQSIRSGALIQIQSLLTDQDGISNVDYAADGAFLDSDGNATDLGGGNFSSQVSWDTTSLVPVKTIALTAKVTNIDGDSATSPPISVVIRPAHCFNVTKDADETAIDCGGAECGSCGGGSCTSSAQCATGDCTSGQCVEQPKIGDVQLRDGKPGNLVTVTGERFGSGQGKVLFLGGTGAADDVEADTTRCQNGWHDTTIVVAIPVGAKSGPIQVTTSAGKTDATNDGYGAIIPDFTVNAVARPGICTVNPSSAAPKDLITLGGSGFGDTQGGSTVTFSPASDTCASVSGPSYDAGAVSPWNDVSARPKVPNIATGSDGVKALVTVTTSGQTSNPVCVQILAPDAGTLPHLDLLSPKDGPVGTYLTLSGTNFGSDGKVKFVKSGQTAFGDTSFPQQCAAKNWSSSNVVVKVPGVFTTPSGTALAQGDYGVSLVRADGTESNIQTFTVNTSALAPGICRIDPDNGPVGTGVSLYGERLGNVLSSDLAALLSSHPDAVQFSQGKNATALGSWSDNAVTTAAPAGSKTGPVVLHTYNGGSTQTSNGINFRLQDCRSAATGTDACGAGLSCCPDGACRLSGDCNAAANTGGFAWQFSTGPIALYPVVLEDATCQAKTDPTAMPSPNPFRGASGVCTNVGTITMRFSLPIDVATLASNVKLEACGSGPAAGTCAAAPTGAANLGNYGTDTNNLLAIPVSALAPSTWYRLTLKSSAVVGLRSLAAVGRPAQPLDGDFDGKSGGDYVTSFRTGATPCVISGLSVQPSNGLIASSSDILKFQAFPLSDTCIILQCADRSVTWTSSDIGKATLAPAGGVGACITNATPITETAPGPAMHVTASIDALTDVADLVIDYANPQVLDYGPHDCTVACPNTKPFAHLNTPMKTSGSGNILTAVKLQRCKNESCLAFDQDVPTSAKFDAVTGLLTLDYGPSGSFSGLLSANTFYRVTIDGSAKSTSDAPLTGLNYGGSAFSWIFRTRTDGNPCGPQSVTLTPPVTTLRYIGEVAAIKADALTSPDACAAGGQLLTGASFPWSWNTTQQPSSPEAFTLRPYDPVATPTVLDTSASLPSHCTSQCLNAGSAAPGTAACGDGKLGKGEACDTPGLSGCTVRCLRVGNSNVGKAVGQCGGPSVDASAGEACDAGDANGKPGSGCDASCLMTGSSPGVSQCGNGSVGAGEECDDDNNVSGDGCSSTCLLEGSDQNVFVCGDGRLDAGESCDYVTAGGLATGLLVSGQTIAISPSDSQSPSFPCTDRCLMRGNTSTGTGALLCGNGVIDAAKGESCDAGANNGKPGFGCSTACLRTGSDAQLRAYCGDTKVTTKFPQGLIANGGGEECDTTKVDAPAKIDPIQYVTAKAQCDGGNQCTGTVSAAVDAIKGNGSISVQCSCTVDSDCTVFDGTLACGAGACCFKRPALPTIKPTDSNKCRNVLTTITFPEKMNDSTLTGNIAVYQQSVGGCSAPFALGPSGGNWLTKLAAATKAAVGKVLGKDVSAAACASVKGTFTHTLVNPEDGKAPYTETTFVPSALYDAGASYVVAIKGGASGVKTATGVGYGSTITQSFAGGSRVCKLDAVAVTPADALIQTSGQSYTFQAKFITEGTTPATELAAIPGVYDWTYAWSTVQNPKGLLTPDKGPAGAFNVSVSTDAKSGATKNGTAQIIAVATLGAVPNIPGLDPTGSTKSGKADVTVMLCDHPWPARNLETGAWAPYIDPETHFKMFYCRDTSTGAILPDLNPSPTQAKVSFGQNITRFCANVMDGPPQHKACTTNADCNNGADACLPKDLLFRFSDANQRDAFGFRVFTNVERLSPAAWYADQKFSATLTPMTVDGYEAGKDTRTTYIVVADKYGDPTLVPYTYVFGYNDNASADTVAIYGQLISNLAFNANMVTSNVTNVCKLGANPIQAADGSVYACSTDLDCFTSVPNPTAGTFCDAPKDKLRRDTKRWQDLRAISDALADAQQQTGAFPKIDSGSFIKGMTTSKWPSWTSLLGAAGSIVDPINNFIACDKYGSACAVTGKPCTGDADCDAKVADDKCQPKFDAETCYSRKTDLFLCPAGSNIYRYTAIGGTDYTLNAEFEYAGTPWAPSCAGLSALECSLRPDCHTVGAACIERVATAASCGGLFNTKQLTCNGVVGGTGCTQDVPSPGVAGCPTGQLCLPSGSVVFGNAVAARCGNSVVEPGEDCESGMTSVSSCQTGGSRVDSCDSTCHFITTKACPGAAVCGNGALEANESCDDGGQNGGYGKCRSGQDKGCSKHCVNTTPRAGFNCTASSCPDISAAICATNANCTGTQVCTDRMQFCGDGVKNGTESCDEGPSNGNYGRCAWDCSGPGPRCGDSSVNGDEECDGSQDTKPGVCMPKGQSIADASIAPNTAIGCTKDADCASGFSCALCGVAQPGNLPQNRAHSCNAAGDVDACTFVGWSACKPSGACGNGTIEGTEECDAGSANSATGACLPSCKKNTCGDGFALKGVEACDNGASNGVACTAPYGTTCSFCKNDCTVETTSGLYCGDASPTIPVNSPPEMCDAGRVAKWCSKTYQKLLSPFGSSATLATGPKACGTSNDCTPGQCKNYAFQPLGPRNASCPSKSSPANFCTPTANNACSKNPGNPNCCDDTQANKCKCPPGYSFDGATLQCKFVPPVNKTGIQQGTECHSSQDCDVDTQYCQSDVNNNGKFDSGTDGEGECIAYGSQCTPDAYSNTFAALNASNYHEGNCVGCSTSCSTVSGKSPYYCGDAVVELRYGEQCEETGDPAATGANGTKTYYGCTKDCTYNATAGYCGDGKLQKDTAINVDEACDKNASGTTYRDGNTCAAQGWGSAGLLDCSSSCKVYGGGCSNGPLNPGEIRVKVMWPNVGNSKDIDTHLMLPTGTSTASPPPPSGMPTHVYYSTNFPSGMHGSTSQDPHGWLSWDDQSANGGKPADCTPNCPFTTATYGLEIMSVNRRANDRFWTSTAANPYKLYVYDYSNSGMTKTVVELCKYKSDPNPAKKNQICNTYSYPTGATGRTWHVLNFYGDYDDTPTIIDVTNAPNKNLYKTANCSNASGAPATGFCPALGL